MFTPEVVQNSIKQTEQTLRQTLEQIFPIEGMKKTMRMTGLEVGKHPALFDFDRQKELKLKGQTLAVSVFGHFELVDKNTGKVIDKDKSKLNAPACAHAQGLFLVDGNEYQAVNQLRLRSGTYTRKRNNDEYETQVNTGNGVELQNPSASRNGVFLHPCRDQEYLALPLFAGPWCIRSIYSTAYRRGTYRYQTEGTTVTRLSKSCATSSRHTDFVRRQKIFRVTEKSSKTSSLKRRAWTPTPYN